MDPKRKFRRACTGWRDETLRRSAAEKSLVVPNAILANK
jgi:hypothetical protein